MPEQLTRPPVLAVQGGDREEIQSLLIAAARRFQAGGVHVIGVVEDMPPGVDHHDVRLLNLADGQTFRLHQDLGSGSAGCSLDPDGLASACAMVESEIATRVAEGGTAADTVVILSKYGREEAEGRGLLTAFYAAVAGELSVLTSLSPSVVEPWRAFVGDMARLDHSDMQAVERWWAQPAAPLAGIG